MKCVLLLRCETWPPCLSQYIIPKVSENAQQCQFLQNCVCYKSRVSRGILMPTTLLNLYLITTLLWLLGDKNLLRFFYCSCAKSPIRLPNAGKVQGCFTTLFSFLSKISIYKAWKHQFIAVGWGQGNPTHSLDRPSFSFSRKLYVGYRNMPRQTRNTCPRIERNAKEIRVFF